MKKNENDLFGEKIARRMERYFLHQQLKGMLVLIAFLGVAAYLKHDAEKKYSLQPPSCEELQKQYGGSADCNELKSRWESVVAYANSFPR